MEKIEKNNVIIALNVLNAKTIKIYPAYVSKYKSKRENSKKSISIIEKNNVYNHGDFYCLNCLHSFATENKRESHKKVCENKYFHNDIMPSEDTKI